MFAVNPDHSIPSNSIYNAIKQLKINPIIFELNDKGGKYEDLNETIISSFTTDYWFSISLRGNTFFGFFDYNDSMMFKLRCEYECNLIKVDTFLERIASPQYSYFDYRNIDILQSISYEDIKMLQCKMTRSSSNIVKTVIKNKQYIFSKIEIEEELKSFQKKKRSV